MHRGSTLGTTQSGRVNAMLVPLPPVAAPMQMGSCTMILAAVRRQSPGSPVEYGLLL